MPTRSSGAGWPSRKWLRYALAALLWITADEAKACQICSAGLVVTAGQRLHAVDQAVLAVSVIGESRFRIVEVIKGKDFADRMIAEDVLGVDATTLRSSIGAIAVKEPASHCAIVSYLQRSPRAAAKAALQSIADKPR